MEWRSFGEGWRRAQVFTPGYDCRTECLPNPKGNHGICSDFWWYVVSDGECAVSLEVRSGNYPSTVHDLDHEGPRGRDLTLHVPWPAENGGLETIDDLVRKGSTGRPCDVVEGGCCWNPRTTALGAVEFFSAHGTASFEQPESFWEALRAKAVEWIAEARAVRAQTVRLVRCACCRGRGVVEIKEER